MLAELRLLGVVLWIDGDGRLAFDAPPHVLDDELLGRMKSNRDELLAEVRASESRARAEELRPKVVKLTKDEFDVRVDRKSKWGNPYPMNARKHNRMEVIAAFRVWLPAQPSLMECLGELRGKRIGCHCAPLDCHGDVIADFVVADAHEQFERAFVEKSQRRRVFDVCPQCNAAELVEEAGGLRCPSCRELVWLYEGASTIRADCESFDEVPLASVPVCFECNRLCDRINGLGLWCCSRCDPLAKTRERKTRDVLKVKRRWGEETPGGR